MANGGGEHCIEDPSLPTATGTGTKSGLIPVPEPDSVSVPVSTLSIMLIMLASLAILIIPVSPVAVVSAELASIVTPADSAVMPTNLIVYSTSGDFIEIVQGIVADYWSSRTCEHMSPASGVHQLYPHCCHTLSCDRTDLDTNSVP